MENPICPKCGMEALRLIEYELEVYCDWDVPEPRLGKPFNPDRWPTIIAMLDGRAVEVAAHAEEEGKQRLPKHPPPERCRNGHQDYKVRTKNGVPGWTCRVCEREGRKR